ncbi:HD-like signal output (HDOD) protein [Azomonas agilis]|uniref:HD-like signal output (HDOD) protein n=1 Tax=Azomonas agilis TaxID=116849 RepID=A0A562IYT8_9GAMM|nr:HDOD domain-containing protein [Azomonas agilis]TWH76211.1 HD-like signal output (HDOD) protein [Azomonas agilis]
MVASVIVESSVPIQQLLEAQGMTEHRLQRDQTGLLEAQQRVQGVWMEDGLGNPLLVLYPRSQLLDLAYIPHLMGRHWQVMAEERQKALLAQHTLGLFACLMAKVPVLCEARLLEQEQLFLEFGQPGWLLDISIEAFKPLLSHARIERFGIALTGIQPANLDEARTKNPHSFTGQRIYQRLDEVVEIPPLSQTAQRLLILQNNPKADVGDLTRIIETDPPLAAQVIGWASSAYYASVSKIHSVQDAIMRALGFERVLNLALGLTLDHNLQLSDQAGTDRNEYWHQAIYTAMLVDGLVKLVPASKRPEPGLAYLAGLLHNFGHLILAYVFPPHFATLCQYQQANPHLSSDILERYLLGVTREQIGGWWVQRWHMPEELAAALYYQKMPDYQGEHSVYPNLIYLAVNLLGQRGIGTALTSEIPTALLMRLGLNLEQVEQALTLMLKAEADLRELVKQIQSHTTH